MSIDVKVPISGAPDTFPAVYERPTTSDQLPTGSWLQQIDADGYRPYTFSNRSEWLPFALGIVSVVISLISVWLSWEHLPERVPLHTSADGNVTRWGETNLTNVLTMPLVGSGVLLCAMVIMCVVSSVSGPRPSIGLIDGADSLGSLLRQSATLTALVRSGCWSCLSILVAILLIDGIHRTNGYRTAPPVWLFGLAILVSILIFCLHLSRVRSMINTELKALEIPIGPNTSQELRAWRYVAVIDDPAAALWVSYGVPRSNYTVNIAKPAGKIMAIGFVSVLVAVAVLLLITPLAAL